MSEFARYWFHMGDEEFGELDQHRFWALCKHHYVEFKRQQYTAGIVAAELWRVTAKQLGGDIEVKPMDFVGKSEEEFWHDFYVDKYTKFREKILEIVPEKLSQARFDALRELTEKGVASAEEIVHEVFGAE